MTYRALNSTTLPTILDREVSSAEDDAFGHQHFAHVLRSLVESASHLPPFSIGLLGLWGTGKSSIKELYLSELQNDPARVRTIRPVTFNAWRHGGEGIKRALLRHVFLNLGGDEEQLKRELFQQIEDASTKSISFKEWVKQAVVANLGPVAVFVVLLAAVVGVAWVFAHFLAGC